VAENAAQRGKIELDKNNLDWVTGRFACSLAGVFKTLRLEVEEDVKTRNSLRPPNSPYEFSILDADGSFTVTLEAQAVSKSVTFHLGEHSIQVRTEKGEPKFELTLGYSTEGECQLKVNQEAREYWQVRRMALEELMFPSY
jgi:hypothetical protein